eukprot:TRINITY_DN2272_c1_g1_i1.p4 TRINITY_DN2272_c1_g1~~TRINITY_DN2272_c1_g1_i1.p4  ORF type:complete len:207 (+),score=46.32 TRINITY_DN2272_c1_g1_i1:207-827(+)
MVSTTTNSKKSKKAGVVHNHPKYETMVTEAIETLGERTGSSGIAIRNYLTAKKEWELPSTFARTLSTQLKKLVVDGKLKKVKASYKLSDSLKNKMKKGGAPAKKSIAKKSTAKKSTAAGVKVAKKKAVVVASSSTAAEKSESKTKKITATKSVGRPKKSAAKKAAPVKKAAAAKKAAISPKKPAMKRKAPTKRTAAPAKAKKTGKK